MQATLTFLLSLFIVGCSGQARKEAHSNYMDKKYKKDFLKLAGDMSSQFVENIGEIADSVCSEKVSVTPECMERIKETYISRLTIHYNYANIDEVSLAIKAYPEKYVYPFDFEKVEDLFKESHKRNIKAAMDIENQEFSLRESEKSRSMWRAIGSAFKDFGKSSSGSENLNCTSSQIGNQTFTNCN